MYTLLAIVLTNVTAPNGICDCLLWTHACVGFTGYISPLALPLGVSEISHLKEEVSIGAYARAPAVLFLLAASSMVTYIGLSVEYSRYWTIIVSSLYMALYVGKSYFNSLDLSLKPLPPPTVLVFTVETTEAVCIGAPLCLDFACMTTEIAENVVPTSPEIPSKDESFASTPLTTVPATPMAVPIRTVAPVFVPAAEWFYLDLKGKVQGPFSTHEMKVWYRANFLPPDLLVANNREPSAFCPLSQCTEQFVD